MQTCKGKCGVSHSLGSELTHCGARLTSEAGVRGAWERGSHPQCSSREVQAAWKQEIQTSFILSRLLCKLQVKMFYRGQQQYPKAEEIRKASKRCLEAKARKCTEGTPTSRRGRGVHQIVPEVGVRGKLHLGFGNPTRMHHGSTLATLNRLPKHLWSLNTTHLLWSYRNRGLGDQPACKAPPP